MQYQCVFPPDTEVLDSDTDLVKLVKEYPLLYFCGSYRYLKSVSEGTAQGAPYLNVLNYNELVVNRGMCKGIRTFYNQVHLFDNIVTTKCTRLSELLINVDKEMKTLYMNYVQLNVSTMICLRFDLQEYLKYPIQIGELFLRLRFTALVENHFILKSLSELLSNEQSIFSDMITTMSTQSLPVLTNTAFSNRLQHLIVIQSELVEVLETLVYLGISNETHNEWVARRRYYCHYKTGRVCIRRGSSTLEYGYKARCDILNHEIPLIAQSEDIAGVIFRCLDKFLIPHFQSSDDQNLQCIVPLIASLGYNHAVFKFTEKLSLAQFKQVIGDCVGAGIWLILLCEELPEEYQNALALIWKEHIELRDADEKDAQMNIKKSGFASELQRNKVNWDMLDFVYKVGYTNGPFCPNVMIVSSSLFKLKSELFVLVDPSTEQLPTATQGTVHPSCVQCQGVQVEDSFAITEKVRGVLEWGVVNMILQDTSHTLMGVVLALGGAFARSHDEHPKVPFHMALLLYLSMASSISLCSHVDTEILHSIQSMASSPGDLVRYRGAQGVVDHRTSAYKPKRVNTLDDNLLKHSQTEEYSMYNEVLSMRSFVSNYVKYNQKVNRDVFTLKASSVLIAFRFNDSELVRLPNTVALLGSLSCNKQEILNLIRALHYELKMVLLPTTNFEVDLSDITCVEDLVTVSNAITSPRNKRVAFQDVLQQALHYSLTKQTDAFLVITGINSLATSILSSMFDQRRQLSILGSNISIPPRLKIVVLATHQQFRTLPRIFKHSIYTIDCDGVA